MSDELDFLTDDDAAAIDRYVAKLAREEEEDINRKQGQQLLDLMTARGDKDPFIELLNRAHQAKASEAEADKQ